MPMDKSLLKEYGINYDEGLARCMGDPAFYKTLLSIFLSDSAFTRAAEAYGAGDLNALFACMHELKGASGTAAFTELYNAICPLVELLRGKAAQADPAETDRLFDAVQTAYARTCEGITKALE